MRLLWYSGASSALAVGVVAYAFNQRANFYSAMVYLSQSNLSLMIIINLILLIYSSFVYGLQRLCYGQLRPIEIEQLYEKAWFAVTETCLAMTIFREEVGAWFLVMFTALVTGKVWGWIGEGRVEILEQQPPTNPRLFHTRLSISLLISIAYDVWMFHYTVSTVIQQARPNMMVMFLFEFAILTACSFRTTIRYLLSLVEADIVKKQTKQRLEERRKQVREQHAEIARRREAGEATDEDITAEQELPREEDIDEMDIEVPGWESKGQWVLSLDLVMDFIKLGIYAGFFAILMMFYGLPIHIMRDLFMTARSFLKRLGALMRYRKAVQDMNRYPDATEEELSRENTCIICREEMRPWDPTNPSAVERSRPKKLPCGHILHFGCLKSWLERQQVCPTCRRSVVIDNNMQPNGQPILARMGADGQADNGGGNGGQLPQQPRAGGMRFFNLGPLRLGFAQGNAQNIQDMAQRMGVPIDAADVPQPRLAGHPAPAQGAATAVSAGQTGSAASIRAQLQEIDLRIQQEVQTVQQELASLQNTHVEMQTLQLLLGELARIRQNQQIHASMGFNPAINAQAAPFQQGYQQQPQPQPQPLPQLHHMPQMAHFPTFPPRMNTPAVTRHGGAAYTTAIPAGSPDLPEGVVIPPGWTLLPLQRLDAQQGAHGSQQPSPQPNQTDPLNQANVRTSQSSHTSASANGVSGDPSARVPYEETESSSTSGPLAQSLEARSEPVSVAAPTPILPNWGGAAQLFANNSTGTSATPPQRAEDTQLESQAEAKEGETRSQRAVDSESQNGDVKGKGKAVTLEDAEDDE